MGWLVNRKKYRISVVSSRRLSEAPIMSDTNYECNCEPQKISEVQCLTSIDLEQCRKGNIWRADGNQINVIPSGQDLDCSKAAKNNYTASIDDDAGGDTGAVAGI